MQKAKILLEAALSYQNTLLLWQLSYYKTAQPFLKPKLSDGREQNLGRFTLLGNERV